MSITLLSSQFANANEKGIDWTPFFKPWANACTYSSELSNLFDNLELKIAGSYEESVDEDNIKLNYKLGKIVLPINYNAAAFNDLMIEFGSENSPEMQTTYHLDANYYDTFFSASGYYYGIPVSQIGAYRGLWNGIRGDYFVLDMPIDKVRNILSSVAEFKYKIETEGSLEGERIGVGISKNIKNEQQTVINCDFSD